jgi:hypothetical protein
VVSVAENAYIVLPDEYGGYAVETRVQR